MLRKVLAGRARADLHEMELSLDLLTACVLTVEQSTCSRDLSRSSLSSAKSADGASSFPECANVP